MNARMGTKSPESKTLFDTSITQNISVSVSNSHIVGENDGCVVGDFVGNEVGGGNVEGIKYMLVQSKTISDTSSTRRIVISCRPLDYFSQFNQEVICSAWWS